MRGFFNSLRLRPTKETVKRPELPSCPFHHRPQNRHLLPCLLITLLLVVVDVAVAARTDEGVLYNGNTITGEVKSLKQGKLEYRTDHAGTLYLEWDYFHFISSNTFFEVENNRGEFFYGTLEPISLSRFDERSSQISLSTYQPMTATIPIHHQTLTTTMDWWHRWVGSSDEQWRKSTR